MTPDPVGTASPSSKAPPPPAGFEEVIRKVRTLEENVRLVIVGKQDAVRVALIPLLCRGHLLVEDVPGVGKTTLAKAIAKSVASDFKRVQFTPDLLPLDITGAAIFNQKTQDFEFRQGPVFTNILLADEINRATPRTQSALLECMEEFQVTVDGKTHKLSDVFCVIATLNPVEQTGTFPLPETQLDRFVLRLRMGYPTEAEEIQIFDRQATAHPIDTLKPVVSQDDVRQMRAALQQIFVHNSIKEYCARLSRATRSHPDVILGASPRGTLSLIRAAQGLAMLSGQSFVTPDHVKRILPAVFGHRIILKPQASLRGLTDEVVLRDVVTKEEVPVAVDRHV